jgi:hypothetical protein
MGLLGLLVRGLGLRQLARDVRDEIGAHGFSGLGG